MTDFERITGPTVRHDTSQGRADGRRAVFTGADDAPSPVDRWLECTVTCARCTRSRSVSPTRLLLACVPFTLVALWRDHPLLARCPACGHIAWLRVRYPAATAGERVVG